MTDKTEIDKNLHCKKKSQTILLDSEIRYRRLFEAAQDGILILDADTGNIEDINPFLLKLLGYSKKEIMGKNLWEIGAFKDINASKEAFLELQTKKYIRYEDLPLVTKKGRLINVEFVSNVYLVNHHCVIQCNIRDITDRKRVEEELKKHTEEIDDLYNNAPCGYHSLDENGLFVRINNTELLWTGYSREEIVNRKKFPEILTPESQNIFKKSFKKLKAQGLIKNQEQEYEMIRKNGEIIPVLINSFATRDASGNFIMSRSSVFDITNLKQVENALEMAYSLLEKKIKERTAELAKTNKQLLLEIKERKRVDKVLVEKQERLDLAHEAAKFSSFEWDIKTNVIYWPDEIESLFGFAPGGLERNFEGWMKLIHPDDIREVKDKIKISFNTGEYLQDFRVIWPDGSNHWLQSRARVYYDQKGKPLRMIGVNMDITSFKEIEIEKEQLRIDLTHVTRVMMLSELSASLAHELNQPMGSIANNAYAAKLLLSQHEADSKELTQILSDIIKDNKRAGNIIQKLRGLVSKTELIFEPLNINNLIRDVIALLNGSIILNKVSLKLKLKPNLPKIRGDQVQLRQVLLNLISNALQAMQDTSKKNLTIQTEISEQSLIIVSVSDSGAGINEKDETEIFKSFFSTKKDGLGMGLPICQSIIEAHSGKVWNEKDQSNSTKFCFTLKVWSEV
jgi:PAS domain S-box-containing protein